MKKLLGLLLILGSCSAQADVQPYEFFQSKMMLQRGAPVPVWGKAAPNEAVSVSIAGQTQKTVANAEGNWELTLNPVPIGLSHQMVIEGKNKIVLEEIAVGDVWLGSGQSNMESDVEGGSNGSVRIFTGLGERETSKQWIKAGRASKLAWPFAKELVKAEGIPVGIVLGAQGGTEIERWIPNDSASKGNGDLYLKYIQPLEKYPVKGIIWWQGEANEGDKNYGDKFKKLITSWREIRKTPELPFLYIQLQRKTKKGGLTTFSDVREGQRQALELPKTGMVVSFDITKGALHPSTGEKVDVAKRLVKVAQALVYGRQIEYTGPLFEKAELNGNEIVLHFTHADGLQTKENQALTGFELKSGSGEFQNVEAKIQDNLVKIPVTGTPDSCQVRYSWRNDPNGNLFNSAGLPASPFQVEIKK